MGNLSLELIKLNSNFLFVEIDKYLIKKLKKIIYKKNKKIYIINNNILKIKLKLIKKFKKFYIVGNFPYNISSKIIMWLIYNRNYIKECVGTFQKEFVYNIIIDKTKKLYKHNTKLTIYINIFFYLKQLFVINKKSFFPTPKVDSIVVIFKKKKNIYIKKKNIKNFFFLVKTFFLYKRKILNYILKKYIKKEKKLKKKFKKYLNKRVEDLNIKDFIYIYGKIKKYGFF